MNKQLLDKHIKQYLQMLQKDPKTYQTDLSDRRERSEFFQSWTTAKIANMSPADLLEYLSRLWAMRVWQNKEYAIEKMIADQGIETVRNGLINLVWANAPLPQRWDDFRDSVKGIGPAMMSEILCHAHPNECIVWNRRAYVALNYLGVDDLPRYNYQLTGAKYCELCKVGIKIAAEMRALGAKEANLLTVDYFLWHELQDEKIVDAPLPPPSQTITIATAKTDSKTAEFIHDEIRDKIVDIGGWLGLQAFSETKVADGAVVDAIWQATIGNMGRVIYVFEVQTKGSVDSLILNLLRSLNNPAVQAVVAVSDKWQLEKIKTEAVKLSDLTTKLRFWDYVKVLDVHESLDSVNEAISNLGLVPHAF
jgi:hypothetical protein